MSHCPRSSLPVQVFDWLVKRLSHLEPQPRPGRGGNPGIPVAVRLDAVWSVIGDGLSYRRAERVIGISKSEVGDSIAMLTPELANIGICQPDGSFVRDLNDLESRCVEMAGTGETVCVDGAGIATQRPASWRNQYQLWDAHHHQHGVHAVVVCDTHGDLLWVDGGWPGQCHELDVIERAGVARVLANTGVRVLADRGYRGLERRDGVNVAHPQGSWKGQSELPDATRVANAGHAGLRSAVERAVAHLANALGFRRWRGRIARIRQVIAAVGAVVSLKRWLHRVTV